MKLIAACLLSLLASCAAAGEQPSPAEPRAHAAPVAPPALASATAAASAAPPELPVPEVELLTLARVLDGPVHSLAFGKKRSAAIGKDAWMDQGGTWSKLPALPHDLEGVRVFFGRDDQPRLMGATSSSGGEGVYRRWKDAGWRLAAYELGGVASGPPAPLFGVLGHADPEVVCKVSGGCLVKRLTGWTEIAGLAGAPFVELCGDVTWAYEGRSVWRLDSKGWAPLAAEPTFERADGLWSTGPTDVWVAERAKSAVHHFDGSKWTRHVSPIVGPRALWARAAKDIWLAGDGGAAHHDGVAWSRVKGAAEKLAVVAGRGAADVWLGGESGLWHGTRSR